MNTYYKKAFLSVAMMVSAACTLLAQNSSYNYIRTQTMLDEQANSYMTDIQYYDNLGRPSLHATNSAGTAGKYVYTLTTYNEAGLEMEKYQPAVGGTYSGNYYTQSDMALLEYVTYDGDFHAYSYTQYDMLGRIKKVLGPGDSWHSNNKYATKEYGVNTSGSVKCYSATNNNSSQITQSGYYAASTLHMEQTTDEDGHTTQVFTDRMGRKVLERRDTDNDTYYVYNTQGQLRFVLSPGYQETASLSLSAYEYRYDARGRMVWKKLPQCEYTQYWYDRADRIAYMRDPALGNCYRFYLYDRLGRLCLQGTCSDGTQDASLLSETSYTGASDGICGTGYTLPYTITDPQLEVVSYYDNYGFLGTNLTGAVPSVTVNAGLQQNAVGFLTGQVTYATNGEGLGFVNVYDQKGQVIRSVRKGLGGHLEDLSTDYTFTGDVESASAEVGVGYGVNFTAETGYTYNYGKKTSMTQSVSHGRPAVARETEYSYDDLGRLSGKERQMTSTRTSSCSYTYDVHGWLTSISSGGFQETIHYADGLDGGCYNGNISTFKWRTNSGLYQGYNLTYDGCNRLTSAEFGAGDNLTSYRDYFNESVQYDCNGNITHLQRRGLVDNMHGGFGLVDNLTMTYAGNQLTSVRDQASHSVYAGATDFDGIPGQEYPLTYNDAGSLTSDAGRRIAWIDYDLMNNPVRIQFTNGNVTKYVYSATGEKLRVTYQTAVPNISVPVGSTRELASYEIQYTDSTDYLLGGRLTLKNGRIDKYLFEEGYCQAESYVYNTSKDNFTFCYYDRDHLGNIRQVREADGTGSGYVIQTIDYYPFGAELCDGTASSDVQPYRYNGKELDRMHGLNTYDYGARQYNPVTARWDRMDPLCEKYYSMSPYNYCGNNPIKFIDPNGMDWYKDSDNTYQYDPNINKKSKLKEGQTYIGESFRRNGAWYRNDGSILFNNETASYNRMWNQADQHYRKLDSGGREVGGFILKDGRVLVLPDYANDNETTKIDYYGYHIQKNGIVKRGDEKFYVIGQVHTHQNKSLSAEPSTYLGDSYGDLGLSVYNSSLPVFTIGHDKKIHGIRGYLGTDNVPVGLIVNMNSRDSSRQNLLNGRTSLFSIIQRLPKL